MSIPAFCAARMMVSPASKGISRSSSLKLGMPDFSEGVSDKMALTIALATDHIQRSEARHDVSHHGAGDHAFETGRDEEAWRADAHAIRGAAAVAHQVEAELAVATFRVRIHFASGQFQAFHHDLEMLNGAFDGAVDLVL